MVEMGLQIHTHSQSGEKQGFLDASPIPVSLHASFMFRDDVSENVLYVSLSRLYVYFSFKLSYKRTLLNKILRKIA